MKKNNVHICSVLLVSLIFSSLMPISVYAEEESNLINESSFNIFTETQNKIDELLEENQTAFDFIHDSIVMFETDVHTTDEEFNQFLLEVVDGAAYAYDEQEVDFIEAQEQNQEIQKAPKTRTSITGAEIAYMAGISLVQSKGCDQTADYMLYARNVVSQGLSKQYYHKYDSWAKSCATNRDFIYHITPQFEEEIASKGKVAGCVRGSFAYTEKNSDLDHFAALHNVNYAVTFTLGNNGYTEAYTITDVYDFDWTNYDNFQIGFANNYCYMMQELGLIEPFNITIYWSSRL